MRRTLAFAIAIALARPAFGAPTKSDCVDADTAGQTHRKHGRLLDARAEFTTCVSATCPEIVQTDCRERLNDVRNAIPTVTVIAPITGTGTAFLTLDGASIAIGTPVDADPGEHELTLNVPGNPPVVRRVTLVAGRKGERVEFPPMKSNAPVVVAPPPSHDERSHGSPLRIAGVVTGAFGVVATGFGIGLGVASFDAWGSAKSACATSATCDLSRANSDRSRAYDFATGSDVAFIAAGVLLAAGVTLFVLGGRASVSVSHDHVAFLVGGTF